MSAFKKLQVGIGVEPNQLTLNRKNGKQTVFNLKDRTIIGYEDKLSEDLRDYLRRRGVKIFTGKNFKSI